MQLCGAIQSGFASPHKVPVVNNKSYIKFARKFSSRYNFLKFLLHADNELLMPEMQKKNWGHRLRFRDIACGKPY